MGSETVAILVAGIPALVAALTFVFAETLKGRRSRSDSIAASVESLIIALQRVVIVESRPPVIRQYQRTAAIAGASASSARLLATVRNRDRVFAYWLIQSSTSLVEGREDRVQWSATLVGELTFWQVNPRAARERARARLGEDAPRF